MEWIRHVARSNIENCIFRIETSNLIMIFSDCCYRWPKECKSLPPNNSHPFLHECACFDPRMTLFFLALSFAVHNIPQCHKYHTASKLCNNASIKIQSNNVIRVSCDKAYSMEFWLPAWETQVILSVVTLGEPWTLEHSPVVRKFTVHHLAFVKFMQPKNSGYTLKPKVWILLSRIMY